MSDKDAPNNETELPTAVLQAAEWVDRLRESCDRQVLGSWRDWVRQSPEHFEEYLCAVVIDLALVALWKPGAPRSNDTTAGIAGQSARRRAEMADETKR